MPRTQAEAGAGARLAILPEYELMADVFIDELDAGLAFEVTASPRGESGRLDVDVEPSPNQVVALRDFTTTIGPSEGTATLRLPETEVASISLSAEADLEETTAFGLRLSDEISIVALVRIR